MLEMDNCPKEIPGKKVFLLLRATKGISGLLVALLGFSGLFRVCRALSGFSGLFGLIWGSFGLAGAPSSLLGDFLDSLRLSRALKSSLGNLMALSTKAFQQPVFDSSIDCNYWMMQVG